MFSATGSIPVGTIIWYSSSSAPIGYLICNGQAVSRTTYPDLFEAIGTTYGPGDGSTTFNLPNLIGKFAEGANSNVGDSVDAGLPNIIGQVTPSVMSGANDGQNVATNSSDTSGAFTNAARGKRNYFTATGTTVNEYNTGIKLDASLSNSIYGNSSTVQPPAVKLLPCIKAYSDVDNLGSCDVAQLENYVQNNVVHTTGDETIYGLKSFYANMILRGGGANTTTLAAYLPNVTAGTSVSETNYGRMIICDSTTSDTGHRFGYFQTAIYTNNNTKTSVCALSNSNPQTAGDICVYACADGTVYATAPSTLSSRTGGTDILTRDWIPQDTRIVHTTGNETIAGTKTFSNNIVLQHSGTAASYTIRNTGFTKGSVYKNHQGGFACTDSTGAVAGGFYFELSSANTNNVVAAQLRVYNPKVTSNTLKVVQLLGASNWGTWNFSPREADDNTINLGQSGGRWKQLYAGTTTISTSDERLKSNVNEISDNVLDCWGNVKWVEFQFNDAVNEKSENARFHTGLIAQEIDRIFKKDSLDISKYGLFCYDSWDAKEAEYDEEGNEIHPASPAGDRYSLRYEEALCMEAAYQRRRADRAEARIKSLEERLSLVESKLNIS